jgi:hypothetical protein
LGEIILVIAGILIALQLNTANQKRIEQERIRNYVEDMVADLAADLRMLAPIQMEMEYLRRRVDLLGEYVRDTPLEELENLRLYVLMRAPYYRPYSWNTAVLEQMKSSGSLGRMENRELAARISSFEALQRHLLDDYAHDRELGVRALALANRVVNMNYPALERWITPTQLTTGVNFINFEALLIPSDLLEELEAFELDMVRRDPAMLGEAVNAYQQIVDAYGLWPRFLIEMPFATRMIRELQRDLCEEYDVSLPPPFEQPYGTTPDDGAAADDQERGAKR